MVRMRLGLRLWLRLRLRLGLWLDGVRHLWRRRPGDGRACDHWAYARRAHAGEEAH
jgi:hypothetical protein